MLPFAGWTLAAMIALLLLLPVVSSLWTGGSSEPSPPPAPVGETDDPGFSKLRRTKEEVMAILNGNFDIVAPAFLVHIVNTVEFPSVLSVTNPGPATVTVTLQTPPALTTPPNVLITASNTAVLGVPAGTVVSASTANTPAAGTWQLVVPG